MTHDPQVDKKRFEADSQSEGILARPAGQLRSLPMRFRWEVTRRHAYYLHTWENASREISEESVAAFMMQQAHRVILGAIGVSGPVVSPQTSFESLIEQIDGPKPAWLFGTVQPLSMRGLAGLLITNLSIESRRSLADLFRLSVDDDEDNRIRALLQLQAIDSAELNTYADQPIVAVSPFLTVNALTTDLREFLDDWRQRFGVSEQRIRSDKIDQYLAVWDAREGWTGSDYEVGDNHSLVDVASDLNLSPSTVRNQYLAAFELITGHPYSTVTWLRIFGSKKYPNHLMSDIDGAAMRRRLQPRGSRPPVPESALALNADQNSFINQSALAVTHDNALWEVFEDVKTLSKAGRTDMEIAVELEIPAEAVSLLKQRIETE